jgi:hypothetical protein
VEESFLSELIDALRRRQVLEPVLAQVAEPVSAHEGRGRGGNEHLTPMRTSGDARRAVNVCAHVALVCHVRRAREHAHAHADRPGGKRALSVGSRRSAPGAVGKT